MKKLYFTIILVMSFSGMAFSQTRPDTSALVKKQTGKTAVKTSGFSKKKTDHKAVNQLKKDSSLSGGGSSGAGTESSGRGLEQVDSTQTKAGKPRVASENAGPGIPGGKTANRKAGSKKAKNWKEKKVIWTRLLNSNILSQIILAVGCNISAFPCW